MSLLTRARIARWAQEVEHDKANAEYLRADLQARCDHINGILRTKVSITDLETYTRPRDILPNRVYATIEGIRFAIPRQHEGYDNNGGGVFTRLYLAEDHDRPYGREGNEIRSLADLANRLDRG